MTKEWMRKVMKDSLDSGKKNLQDRKSLIIPPWPINKHINLFWRTKEDKKVISLLFKFS